MPETYPHWEKTKKLFQQLFVWAIAFLCGLVAIIYLVTPENERLAQEYGVPIDAVVIQAKPHGCDFDDAPLGNKHCQYRKHTYVERECPAATCRVTKVYVQWIEVED